MGMVMLRIVAAWFSAFGLGLLWFRVEHDGRRIALLPTLMITAARELVIIMVHRAELSITGPRLWLYCAHLASVGL